MQTVQSGILAEVPSLARYLSFAVDDSSKVRDALMAIAASTDTDLTVIGIGEDTLRCLDASIEDLHEFPSGVFNGTEMPSTPVALWCWCRGDDRGELFHRSRDIEALAAGGFRLIETIDAFRYDSGRDISGYEDGTENPEGDDAIAAAIVNDKGPGMDGSSFLAVQRWTHDLDALDSMDVDQRDDAIGRHINDNEEFDSAPLSAHVKRSAQENFEPEAFILRRSMPWAERMEAGLVFTSFGHSLDAFEAILSRMLGEEDGIVDGLFQFTHPVSGAYLWCPPVRDGQLDLSHIGL